MIKRALMALVACLAMAAVAAACGGGGDSTSGGDESSADSGSAPTKAAFIKEADAICKEADTEVLGEIGSYEKENGISTKEPSQAQREELYKEVVLPNVARQGEEIEALTPPAGDEDEIGEIVEALDQGVEEGEADPAQLVEGKNPLADAGSQAKAYGMKACGSG